MASASIVGVWTCFKLQLCTLSENSHASLTSAVQHFYENANDRLEFVEVLSGSCESIE